MTARENGRFKPGQSGNPSGRKVGHESEAKKFRAAAEKIAQSKAKCPRYGENGCAVERFESWHEFVAHCGRVHGDSCAMQLLDRYFPKPPAEVHVGEKPLPPTEAEMEKIRAQRARLYEERFPQREPKRWPVPIEELIGRDVKPGEEAQN